MARFPPLRWVVPRIVAGLLFIACIQLVTYMGVIPSTQQNAEFCNCVSSKVVIECPKTQEEPNSNLKSLQDKTSDISKSSKVEATSINLKLPINEKAADSSKGGKITSEDKRTLENKNEELIKSHLEQLDRLSKDLKQLALDLVQTQRDSVKHASIFHRLGMHVSSVNNLLHSVQQPLVVNDNSMGKKVVNKEGSKLKNIVCPETFLGKDLSVGYPWFRKGFAAVNCTKFVPLPDLITVLIHVHNRLPKPAYDLQTIVTSISKQYPGVQIIAATGPEYPKLRNISKLPLKVKVFSKNHQGEIWTSLLSDVTTPFVFTATDMTHFDDDIDFVRLIRVLSNNDDAVIAGGGYRDQKGHWDIGCLQTSFKNWTMSFRGGYYQSSGDCLACDHVAGPWVGKTKELKKTGFDKR